MAGAATATPADERVRASTKIRGSGAMKVATIKKMPSASATPGGASCRTGTHAGRRMAAARRSGKEPSAQRQRLQR